jgi:fructose-1,6-bisphosphatase III
MKRRCDFCAYWESNIPTVQAASTAIINLTASLHMPKGTEHFVSDIHGEYEAFLHVLV